jgi:UDP-N-acetylmuramoylalanine-D-glutamate ligase
VLEAACAELARAARAAVLFGDAAERLAPKLGGVDVTQVETVAEAVDVARRLAPGAEAVVFAPGFPVDLVDRQSFAALAAG